MQQFSATQCLTACLLLTLGATPAAAEIIERTAQDTLTAVEMAPGDELQFRLCCGRVVSLRLEDTGAAIVEKVEPGGIVYRFSADVRIDGQTMRMERYVCSQECFYEPWVVNGLRIWLDTVRDVFDLIPVRYPRKGNLQCVPRKAARLAVQDATLRICPDKVHLWLDHEGGSLDVGQCYNGDDCYLGPYLGRACHVGMDINHAKGSLLYAPIRFDTHAYFNSLAAGDNNNRWRGIRRWENGDIWALQSHHLIELLVPENEPLAAGTEYATTAGVHVGSHQHTHFEFKTGRARQGGTGKPASIASPIDFDDESQLAQEQPEVFHLDPWIVFWQAFEDRRKDRGEIRAAMQPLAPAQTGQPVQFSAAGSQPGPEGADLRYYWAFGNGGLATGPLVTHTFPRPGVFPIRLVVDDGVSRDSAIQWITVAGEATQRQPLVLDASDEPGFHPWPAGATETYGQPVQEIPCTLTFVARPSRPRPGTKLVRLVNAGGGRLDVSRTARVSSGQSTDWLEIEHLGKGADRRLSVTVDARGLSPGTYSTEVEIVCAGAKNSPRMFRVELDVPEGAPKAEVTVDDADAGFRATPGFWVGHRFCRCPADRRGYGGFYLTNGGRNLAGAFARFTPDLQAGRYQVALSDETPFSPGVEFDVRVRHADGDTTVRMRPETSRTIGEFPFHEGSDGFVEILAENSKGLVIADAMHFRKMEAASAPSSSR